MKENYMEELCMEREQKIRKNKGSMKFYKIGFWVLLFITIFLGIFYWFASNLNMKYRYNKDNCQIIANDQYEEYFVRFNDSSRDVYNFHKNRKLMYYVPEVNKKMNGEAVYLYDNGIVSKKAYYRNGINDCYEYAFYPSGNISQFGMIKDDKLVGYQVAFYDKTGAYKTEFLYLPDGHYYVYRRDYDSATGKTLDLFDDRKRYFKIHPELNIEDYKIRGE